MADAKFNPIAEEIAAKLNETEARVIRNIERLIKFGSEDLAKALLEETLSIEANGGLMTNDKSRRRTLGGVFFYLAKGKLDKETRLKIFPEYQKQQKKKQKDPQAESTQQQNPESSPE